MLLANGLDSWGLLVLRVFLGAIFFYHSIPKLIASGKMAKGMGWSSSSVFLLGFVEFISSLALIFGFYAEIGAVGEFGLAAGLLQGYARADQKSTAGCRALP